MSQGILGVRDQGLGFKKHQKSRKIAELKEGSWDKQVEKKLRKSVTGKSSTINREKPRKSETGKSSKIIRENRERAGPCDL